MLEHVNITLPSSKQQIKIRPIKVREEKILVMGKEEEDKDFLNALVQVVQSCTITEGFDWMKQSYADFSYAFIQLRNISKGDTVTVLMKCQTPTCKAHINADERELPIDGIVQIMNQTDHKRSHVVKLSETLGVELENQKVSFVLKILDDKKMTKKNQYLLNLEVMRHHIKAIMEGDERRTVSLEEATDFLDNRSREERIKILDWFYDEPKPFISMKWKCERCQAENIAAEVDVINFFDLL